MQNQSFQPQFGSNQGPPMFNTAPQGFAPNSGYNPQSKLFEGSTKMLGYPQQPQNMPQQYYGAPQAGWTGGAPNYGGPQGNYGPPPPGWQQQPQQPQQPQQSQQGWQPQPYGQPNQGQGWGNAGPKYVFILLI